MCQEICIDPPCDCDMYACHCVPDEWMTSVPSTGAWLVIDGVVRRVDSHWTEIETADGRARMGVALGPKDPA